MQHPDSDSENDWRDMEPDSDEDRAEFETRVEQAREKYRVTKKERRKRRVEAEQSVKRKAEIKVEVMSNQNKRARQDGGSAHVAVAVPPVNIIAALPPNNAGVNPAYAIGAAVVLCNPVLWLPAAA